MKRTWKTAAEMQAENDAAARALPVEVKRRFWQAMTEEHMNLGQARAIDNIDLMVAAQLVVQCHTTLNIPMKAEDIK